MIERTISDIKFFVDEKSARDIYFDEKTVEKYKINSETTQGDILHIFSQDGYKPLYLMWEILDKCNFSCQFCYIVGHSNNRLKRFKDVKPHLDELIDNGLLYCLLTGGEIFYHKDFLEIYLYLKKKGVFVELYTNGYALNDDIIDVFREYPPYSVEITIYAIDDFIFKENTNTNYQSKVILNNILKLKENGINIKTKTPVNKLTDREIEKIKNWCELNCIDYYFSTNISIAYDGCSKDSWKSNDDIIHKYDLENEKKFVENFGKVYESKSKTCFSCSVGKYGLHINSKFELLPCSSFNSKNFHYNIIDNGINNAIINMIEDVKIFDGKNIIDCVGCSASSFCKMCPAIASQEFNQKGELIGFKTNSSYCNDTRKRFNNIMKELYE